MSQRNLLQNTGVRAHRRASDTADRKRVISDLRLAVPGIVIHTGSRRREVNVNVFLKIGAVGETVSELQPHLSLRETAKRQKLTQKTVTRSHLLGFYTLPTQVWTVLYRSAAITTTCWFPTA